MFRVGTLSIEELYALNSSHRELFSYDVLSEMLGMVALAEFQTKMFSGNRQKRNSCVQWNEMEETICQREIPSPFLNFRYCMKDVQITTFSTNLSVLLKGFRLVSTGEEFRLRRLSPCFKITEKPDPSTECIFVYDEAPKIIRKNSLVWMENPLLIKCGLIYEVRWTMSEMDKCFSCRILKPEVYVQPDFTVHFDDVPSFRGLFQELIFIRF